MGVDSESSDSGSSSAVVTRHSDPDEVEFFTEIITKG